MAARMTKSPGEGARLPIKILVDTNIWLDYFLARGVHHHAVSAFIAKAYEREDIVLYVPSLSLKDLAHQLASLMKLDARRAGKDISPDIAAAAREVSWGCMRSVLEKALLSATRRCSAPSPTSASTMTSKMASSSPRSTPSMRTSS